MCNKNIVGLGGIGAIKLVHAYDKDGSLYGTGVIDKKKGNRVFVRFDSKTVREFPSSRVKTVK
tara:strand:- start:291 stop:479 length:189 start_codon:yes stop_codon:yes gene_type:complete